MPLSLFLSFFFPRFLSPLTILQWRRERRDGTRRTVRSRRDYERIAADGNFSKDNEFCLELLERGNPSFIINTGLEESCRLFRRNNVSSRGFVNGTFPAEFFQPRERGSLTDFDDILPAHRDVSRLWPESQGKSCLTSIHSVFLGTWPIFSRLFFFYFNPRFFYQDCLYLVI